MEPSVGAAVDGPSAADLGEDDERDPRGEVPRDAALALPAEDEEPLDLLEAAELLRSELGALRLPLAVAGVDQGRKERDALIAQLDDYLLPRLRRMAKPLFCTARRAVKQKS